MNLPVRVRAPATTANLGPGFDCAGAALDLWNELEVSRADALAVVVEGEGVGELPTDGSHLAVRAFSLLNDPAGLRFVFVNRIPLARGLGSSAAAIASGLVAASLTIGRRPEVEPLLELALELEPHADNLAPALAGGVCLTWSSGGTQRVARLAQDLPLVPIAVVPDARVSTSAARAALPAEIPHAAATFTVGRAALLGAGIVARAPELLAEAFDDRLHEPYRGPLSPVFERIRSDLPTGAVGATISGSGPTVVVWTREGEAGACEAALRERFPGSRVLRLAIAENGAGPVRP